MRTLLSVIAAASFVIGCQPAGQTAAGEAPATDNGPPASEVAGTIPTDATTYPEGEPRWMLSEDGAEQFLAFAVPETDDVRLLMSCAKGARSVRLWRTTWEGDTPDFIFSSGTAEGTFSGVEIPEGMEPQLESAALTSEPVLVAFRTTGQLLMTAGGEARDVSAAPGALPLVNAFFEHCGS